MIPPTSDRNAHSQPAQSPSTVRGRVNRWLLHRSDRVLVQFARYTIVGGGAFVLDFAVLVALTELAGLHYLASAAAGFGAGLLANYVISVKWVFHRRKVSRRSVEFLVFGVIGLLGLGLTELSMWALTDLIGMHYTIGKIGTTVLVYLWNFFARRTLLFT